MAIRFSYLILKTHKKSREDLRRLRAFHYFFVEKSHILVIGRPSSMSRTKIQTKFRNFMKFPIRGTSQLLPQVTLRFCWNLVQAALLRARRVAWMFWNVLKSLEEWSSEMFRKLFFSKVFQMKLKRFQIFLDVFNLCFHWRTRTSSAAVLRLAPSGFLQKRDIESS